jgi:selenide,water dikinase
MVQLNRAAAEALARLPAGAVHACTDITGFGLIGHATEMAAASGAVLVIDVGLVPLLDGALDLVERNTPGGGRTNQEHFSGGVDVTSGLDARRVQLLYDPQTSGGLLVALAPDSADVAIAALSRAGVAAFGIGTVALRQAPDSHAERRMVAVTLR